MEEIEEKKEKEILKRTLSYYDKKGGPLSDEGEKVNKVKIVKQYPLWVYVVGVIVVLAIINFFIRSQGMVASSGGFLAGMLAMYIAMRFYKCK